MSLHALVETTASKEHAVVPPIADIFLEFLIPVSASRKTTASNESVVVSPIFGILNTRFGVMVTQALYAHCNRRVIVLVREVRSP